MSKLMVGTGLAATLALAASMAWAAAPKGVEAKAAAKPSAVTGKVHSVDVVNEVVTLEDGKYYMFPPAIKLDELKAGDQITISVDKDAQGNNTNKANALTKN